MGPCFAWQVGSYWCSNGTNGNAIDIIKKSKLADLLLAQHPCKNKQWKKRYYGSYEYNQSFRHLYSSRLSPIYLRAAIFAVVININVCRSTFFMQRYWFYAKERLRKSWVPGAFGISVSVIWFKLIISADQFSWVSAFLAAKAAKYSRTNQNYHYNNDNQPPYPFISAAKASFLFRHVIHSLRY